MNPTIETYGLRYLTAGGAHVLIDKDIAAALEYEERYDAYDVRPFGVDFAWRVTCHGCGWNEPGAWEPSVRQAAQEHAEICRAVPRTGQEPPSGTFAEALTARLERLKAGARTEFAGDEFAAYGDKYWLEFTPRERDAGRFAVFIWRMAVLCAALREQQGGPDSRGPGALAAQYRARYQELTAGWPR